MNAIPPDGPTVPLIGTCRTCGGETAWLSDQCTACGLVQLFCVPDNEFDDAATAFFTDLNHKWEYETTEDKP